jgi:hypothetical protein
MRLKGNVLTADDGLERAIQPAFWQVPFVEKLRKAEDNWGPKNSGNLRGKMSTVSKPLRPSACSVKDAQYFQALATHTIGDDVRRAGNDQFSSANHPSRAAQRGIVMQSRYGLGY